MNPHSPRHRDQKSLKRHIRSNILGMRKSIVSCILALAALISAHGDMKNPLSIKLSNDPCLFSICLSNGDTTPIRFLNSFAKEQSPKGVPAFTALFIRDRAGHLLSKIKGSAKDFGDGYTWLIYQSELLPDFPLSTLKPKESLSVQYSLRKLALGLFENTSAERRMIGSYQMKIETRIFLDRERKTFFKADSGWVQVPACLLE